MKNVPQKQIDWADALVPALKQVADRNKISYGLFDIATMGISSDSNWSIKIPKELNDILIKHDNKVKINSRSENNVVIYTLKGIDEGKLEELAGFQKGQIEKSRGAKELEAMHPTKSGPEVSKVSAVKDVSSEEMEKANGFVTRLNKVAEKAGLGDHINSRGEKSLHASAFGQSRDGKMSVRISPALKKYMEERNIHLGVVRGSGDDKRGDAYRLKEIDEKAMVNLETVAAKGTLSKGTEKLGKEYGSKELEAITKEQPWLKKLMLRIKETEINIGSHRYSNLPKNPNQNQGKGK